MIQNERFSSDYFKNLTVLMPRLDHERVLKAIIPVVESGEIETTAIRYIEGFSFEHEGTRYRWHRGDWQYTLPRESTNFELDFDYETFVADTLMTYFSIMSQARK